MRAPGLPRPQRIDVYPGTPFGVAVVGVPTVPSGPATGSLVAGLGSLLVAVGVSCFALVGAQGGWGPVVAGAFAALAGFAALAALLLAALGLRQVRRGSGMVTGRGLAVAGRWCGAAGLLLTVIGLVGAFALA